MKNFLISDKIKKIELYFFYILLYELFLCGSGRIISFGFLTLRMLLFSISLIWFSIKLYYEPKDRFIFRIITFFIIVLLIGIIVGYLNNASKELIFIDVKQLLFFLSIIGFSVFIKTIKEVNYIIKSIKISTVILAVSYLICLGLLKLNIFKMEPFYNTLSVQWLYEEFMFRGSSGNFFYKGFFYFGIGIFFFLFSRPTIKNALIAILIYVALFLTLLRWLLAITLVVYLSAIFFTWAYNKFKISYLKSKEMIFHLIIASIMILIPLTCKNFYIASLGNKEVSIDVRKQQFYEVKSEIFTEKKINPIVNQQEKNTNESFNFFVGKGFGIGVPARPIHMELTYLEIFFKQGFLGISFWLFILIHFIYNFKLICKNNSVVNTNIPWLAGVLVIYLQSITNPLLVNSIGMSFIIIALLVIRAKSLKKL